MSKLYVDEISPKTTGSHVVLTNRPFFYATVDQTSTQNAGGTIIPFGTVIEDTENAYNAGTYNYTVPIAGLWLLKMQVRINNNSNANTYTRVAIHRNGASPNVMKVGDPIVQGQGTAYNNLVQDFIFRCEVGDVLDVRNHGASNIQTQQNECHFQGIFMGT